MADLLLLAIDDDPGRYDYLRVLLDERAEAGRTTMRLVVAACRACVAEYLPAASAILLDFDLDGREECAACKGWIDVRNGMDYADDVIGRGVPVIVSSCSSHANRAALTEKVRTGGAPVVAIAADHMGVEREWLGALWVWGVTDVHRDALAGRGGG